MKSCSTDQIDAGSASPALGGAISRDVVLVGFAEALAAPEVVWSLVDDGFDVVAFGRRGRGSALRHSRYVICHDVCPPEMDLEACLSDIRALVASLCSRTEQARPIVFPLDDKAVLVCSRLQYHRPWLLAGPRDGAAELALNKHLQFQAAREAGFNVPEAVLARTAHEVFSFSAAQAFPIILKPAESAPTHNDRVCESRKWICANRGELDRAVATWAERVPILVQRFVTGNGEGVFGLAAPDGVRAWSAHRRLRMMNPQGSGSSACISEEVSLDIRRKAEKFVEAAGWQGMFMIELLRDCSGKVWFVEVNGRPWGSTALSRRQGFEYPAWHVRLAIDLQSRAGTGATPSPGLVCRHVGRELMHVLFVLRGARSKAIRNWPSFWRTLLDVLRIRRSDTFYNWRPEDPKVFIADCYYTMHGNLLKTRH